MNHSGLSLGPVKVSCFDSKIKETCQKWHLWETSKATAAFEECLSHIYRKTSSWSQRLLEKIQWIFWDKMETFRKWMSYHVWNKTHSSLFKKKTIILTVKAWWGCDSGVTHFELFKPLIGLLAFIPQPTSALVIYKLRWW